MDVRDEETVRAGSRGSLWPPRAGLDGVVSSAGYGVFGSVEELPMETARQQFETNVFGGARRCCAPPCRICGSAGAGW